MVNATLQNRLLYFVKFKNVLYQYMKVSVVFLDVASPPKSGSVFNQWNGMVEWNTGMEYWNYIN